MRNGEWERERYSNVGKRSIAAGSNDIFCSSFPIPHSTFPISFSFIPHSAFPIPHCLRGFPSRWSPPGSRPQSRPARLLPWARTISQSARLGARARSPTSSSKRSKQLGPGIEEPAVNEKLVRIEDVDHGSHAHGQVCSHLLEFVVDLPTLSAQSGHEFFDRDRPADLFRHARTRAASVATVSKQP